MEITGLPTENLYKFLALSGLLILTAIPAYLYRIYAQLNEKLIDAELEAEIIQHQTENFRSMLDLKFPVDKLLSGDVGVVDKAGILETRQQYLELGIQQSKFGANVKRVRFLHDNVIKIRGLAYLAVLAGLMMTGTGFYRWYIIQEHIDAEIMKTGSK